jgi:hypothetical protein
LLVSSASSKCGPELGHDAIISGRARMAARRARNPLLARELESEALVEAGEVGHRRGIDALLGRRSKSEPQMESWMRSCGRPVSARDSRAGAPA